MKQKSNLVVRAKWNIKRMVILMLTLPCIISLISADRATNSDAVDFTKQYFNNYLDSLSVWAVQMKTITTYADTDELQQSFLKGRALYKHIEFIVEYYYPSSAARLNGAPLLEAEPSKNLEPKYPEGFQVLEEFVYEDLTLESRQHINFEVDNIVRAVNRLKAISPNLEPTGSEILDALRLNIYQMMIKGISGFDAPAALSGIKEATSVLKTVADVTDRFANTALVKDKIQSALVYLEKNKKDFNDFDRALFIRNYINPLCISLYDFQVANNISFVKANRAIRTDARHLFEPDAFNIYFFAPSGTSTLNDDQVALGKQLFHDKRLSSTLDRSCSSCHLPNYAFADSVKVNESLMGDKKLLRNTPTLLNAALQPAQFYDSRISFLEDQVHDVVTNKSEMDGSLTDIGQKLAKDKEYKDLFRVAYPSETVSADVIRKALAAYIRSLTNFNSSFDRYMNGDSSAMNAESIKGFNLFMGKAKCGTCHFMPLFNGAALPFYSKMESEVLGIPEKNDTAYATLDRDSGKYHLYKIPHQLHSFKTVTVRNAERTSPYMHNGVFRTLEDVIDFYNRGGGAGIGIRLENQTLSPDRLSLTSQEKQQLIAFLRALSSDKKY